MRTVSPCQSGGVPETARRGARRAVPLLLIFVTVAAAGLPAACAASIAVGRGGTVYEVRVATVNGTPTAATGSVAHPACTIQVGDRVARVWLAHPSNHDHLSPVVLEADAVALKDGILVERGWNEAVVHQVTDAELAAGAAVVYVPGATHPTTVELGFEPVPRLGRSDQKNDLAKGSPGLQQPVSGGRLR